MNLTGTIETAEHQFKQILEEFFIGVYDEKALTSHGIEHHRRVWSYAKELFALLAERNIIRDSTLPFKLIIASYLHDIGMSIDPGIRHGQYSRDLCKQFLDQNHFPLNDFQDVLTAIENHDRKDYVGITSVNDLLTILSVADDLDAFGFTGIFRYSEIYLTRGIYPEDIGHLIKENAGKRFNNFIKTFGFSDELVQKHEKRYRLLDDFFNKYNSQVQSYQFVNHSVSGYCGVIEVFLEMSQKKIALKDLCSDPQKCSNDPVIRWFFDELAIELF